jgi:hypothetical protein
MDVYIVRIYRIDEDEPGMLAGIVERAEDGEKTSFSGIEELCGILEEKER